MNSNKFIDGVQHTAADNSDTTAPQHNGHQATTATTETVLQVLAAPAIMQRRAFAVASLKPQPKGKSDKAPRTPSTRKLAETNDLDTLGTYAEAMAAVASGRAKACGPVLKRDGVICIDLDNAFNPDTGEITDGAADIIARFPGALITISASGRGLHVWIKSPPPFSKACDNYHHRSQKIEILAEKFVVEFWQPFGDAGEILPFENELKTLYSEKPAPKPTAPQKNSPQVLAASNGSAPRGYEAAAVMGKLNDARAKMEAAADGEKHNLRHNLAHWLAGYFHLGYFTDAEVWDALTVNITGDEKTAHKAIADGIETGKAKPLTIETPAPRAETRNGEFPAPQVLGADGEAIRPRYEIFSLADMAKMPRLKWLIRGLLLEKIASVLSADSGCFKSFISLMMALCITTGREFLGREVRQGAAVYVAAEGFYTLYERALGWAQENECELPENFHILRVPVNVADPLTVRDFAAQIKDLQPVFVVLDTLSQNAAGMNENDNAAMADFVRGMMALGHEIGAHVQVLHHNAKSTGTLRGAGSIKNNADAHITLDRPEGDAENTVFVRCEKQRGKPFDAFALRGKEVVLPMADEYGDEITTLVFEPCGDAVAPKAKHPNAQKADKTGAALMEIFDIVAIEAAEYGGVKVGFWKEKVEETTDAKGEPICSEKTFWRHRKALEKAGIIEQCGTHNGSQLFRRKARELSKVSQLSQLSHDSNDTTPKDAKNVLSQLSQPFRGDSCDSTLAIGRENGATLPEMPPETAQSNSKATSEPYTATFGPSAETEAKRAAIMAANPPTHCRACKKPLTDKEKRGHAQWEGDTPLIECAPCQAFYSDSPTPAEESEEF